MWRVTMLRIALFMIWTFSNVRNPFTDEIIEVLAKRVVTRDSYSSFKDAVVVSSSKIASRTINVVKGLDFAKRHGGKLLRFRQRIISIKSHSGEDIDDIDEDVITELFNKEPALFNYITCGTNMPCPGFLLSNLCTASGLANSAEIQVHEALWDPSQEEHTKASIQSQSSTAVIEVPVPVAVVASVSEIVAAKWPPQYKSATGRGVFTILNDSMPKRETTRVLLRNQTYVITHSGFCYQMAFSGNDFKVQGKTLDASLIDFNSNEGNGFILPTTLPSALVLLSRVRKIDHLALLPLISLGGEPTLQNIIKGLSWMKDLTQDENLVLWCKGLLDTSPKSGGCLWVPSQG